MIKKINYFFQTIFILSFFILGKILGISLSRKLFSYIFSTIGPFFKSKKIIDKNLHIFSNDISILEKKKIIKNMWKNYGMTFIEYMFLSRLRKNNSHIEIIGEENLRDLPVNGKPVIFISGHFANFELMSMEITKKKN